MYEQVNIGAMDMELVRRVLNEKVTINSGMIITSLPDQNVGTNVGRCKRSGTFYDLDIDLVVPEDDFFSIVGTVLSPELLINPDHVVTYRDYFYLQLGGLLLFIGSADETSMRLSIPAACTARSFKAKSKRNLNRK